MRHAHLLRAPIGLRAIAAVSLLLLLPLLRFAIGLASRRGGAVDLAPQRLTLTGDRDCRRRGRVVGKHIGRLFSAGAEEQLPQLSDRRSLVLDQFRHIVVRLEQRSQELHVLGRHSGLRDPAQ